VHPRPPGQVQEQRQVQHDLFIQQMKLKNTLRWMMGEEQITHLGLEYYLDEVDAMAGV
jgi:myo-inositol-1-phosphate synthase